MPSESFNDPDDIRLLLAACQQAGIDPGKVSASNPHLKTGATAEKLQSYAAMIDPMRAANWAAAANKKPSLRSIAALAGVTDFDQQAHNELMNVDPAYAQTFNRQQAEKEQAALEEMRKGQQELHKANYYAMYGPEKGQWMLDREKMAEEEAAASQQSGAV